MPCFIMRREAWGPLGRLLSDSVDSILSNAFTATTQSVAVENITSELRSCPVPILYLQVAADLIIGKSCWDLIRSDTDIV
jgi:hypothetical protein